MKEIETIKKVNIKNMQNLVKDMLNNKLDVAKEIIYNKDNINVLVVNRVAIYKMFNDEIVIDREKLNNCYKQNDDKIIEFLKVSEEDKECFYTKEIKQIKKIQACKFTSSDSEQLQYYYDYNYLKQYLNELNNFKWYFKQLNNTVMLLCAKDQRDDSYYCFSVLPIKVCE